VIEEPVTFSGQHRGPWRSDMHVILITKAQRKQLLKNGEEQREAQKRGK